MYPYSDEDEDDIEFEEIIELDDDDNESESFNEDEAAMADLEIDWHPMNSRTCHAPLDNSTSSPTPPHTNQEQVMIYALSLYEVGVEKTPAFRSLFLAGGLWQSFASRLTGHIHTTVMRDVRSPHIFLILEFWATQSHYIAAREAAEVRAFELSIEALTNSRRNLGLFAFQNPDNQTRIACGES